MTIVLVTDIEPFDGESLKPSWEVARRLEGEQVEGATLVARQLPCVIGRVNPALFQMLTVLRPSLVLCLGQASCRADITLERVAINIVDARIPDNAGQQPVDEPIFPQGPAGYFSTLSIKAMVRALRRQGIPPLFPRPPVPTMVTRFFTVFATLSPAGKPPCVADLSIYPICRRWRRSIPVRPVWRWRPNLTP